METTLKDVKVKAKVKEKLAKGVSIDKVAKELAVGFGAEVGKVKAVLLKQLQEEVNLEDEAKKLIAYVPDAIDVFVNAMHEYYGATNFHLKKLAVDTAIKLLRSVGLLASEPESYQIARTINNTMITADVKLLLQEFRDKMEQVGKEAQEVAVANIQVEAS